MGEENYKRRNALNIDLNRDAKKLSQPESKCLRDVFNRLNHINDVLSHLGAEGSQVELSFSGVKSSGRKSKPSACRTSWSRLPRDATRRWTYDSAGWFGWATATRRRRGSTRDFAGRD